jgi:hypothetical protein
MTAKVVLRLASLSNAEILIVGTHYTTNMTNNPLFLAADIVSQVTSTKGAITALTTAMNAPTSDTKITTIKQNRDALNIALNILAGKVEAVANLPTVAADAREGILKSAGMEIRKQKASNQKRVFTATQGSVSGSVKLTAPADADAYEWMYTLDLTGETGLTKTPVTIASTTEIKDLRPLTKYLFYYRGVYRRGNITDWEGPITFSVM